MADLGLVRVSIARSVSDLEKACRLRYEIYVDEMGKRFPQADND